MLILGAIQCSIGFGFLVPIGGEPRGRVGGLPFTPRGGGGVKLSIRSRCLCHAKGKKGVKIACKYSDKRNQWTALSLEPAVQRMPRHAANFQTS